MKVEMLCLTVARYSHSARSFNVELRMVSHLSDELLRRPFASL